jgi:hypothetical protein
MVNIIQKLIDIIEELSNMSSELVNNCNKLMRIIVKEFKKGNINEETIEQIQKITIPMQKQIDNDYLDLIDKALATIENIKNNPREYDFKNTIQKMLDKQRLNIKEDITQQLKPINARLKILENDVKLI